jgi:inosose dehydratase
MSNPVPSRREFLSDSLGTFGGVKALPVAVVRPIETLPGTSGTAAGKNKIHVACNQYSWTVFYQREGKDFNKVLDEGLADVAASGLDGFEPGVGGREQIPQIVSLLKKHGLEMRSLYANSTLHEAGQRDRSIEEVVSTAAVAQTSGTRIVVTNPSPIQWAGPQNKTDEQLRIQAESLNLLGAKLKQMGLTLAYHNHDMELRNAAREFHHMMIGTEPKYVTLCLDAHWIYRGTGNSQVALFDILQLYGPRVSELHLRQSRQGVWTECFGPGDIDYDRLSRHFQKINVQPLLVLEQAIEPGSPNQTKPVEAFLKSTGYVRQIFPAFTA